MKAKKLARLALLTALMLVLGYIESLLPITAGIPGIKIGLSNAVLLFALYLIDENNTFIDSLIYSPNVINPGLTDENFIVISKSKSFIPIPISLEKMNSLYTAKKIIILIEFNTTAYPNYIKIYNHYNLDLKLTGDFKIMIN